MQENLTDLEEIRALYPVRAHPNAPQAPAEPTGCNCRWNGEEVGNLSMSKTSNLGIEMKNELTGDAALRLDAERYRWLRGIGHEQLNVLAHYAGPAMDEAIDKAIAQAVQPS